MDSDFLIEEVKRIVNGDGGEEEKLFDICEILRKNVEHYDWVGFYLVEDGGLVLGPFTGEPTEHTDIEFGEGVCGQAAQSEKTFVVQDVREESNYLSCSVEVRSEIVVPIFDGGKVKGEIDIDSHQEGPFTDEDEMLLNEIAEVVRPLL